MAAWRKARAVGRRANNVKGVWVSAQVFQLNTALPQKFASGRANPANRG